MDTETATIVLYSIAGLGFLVWLASVEYLRRARLQHAGRAEGLSLRDFFPDEPSAAGWCLGSATVAGQPATLSDKVVAALAGPAGIGFGPLKVLGKSEREVSFEWGGPALVGQQRVWWFRRGKFLFTSLGGSSTRIDYALELKPLNRWLRVAGIVQFFGLVFLVSLFWLLSTFVVSAAEEGIRWQSVQMVQAIHLLWPPFLFVTLYRRCRASVQSRFDTFLNNLPYLGRGE